MIKNYNKKILIFLVFLIFSSCSSLKNNIKSDNADLSNKKKVKGKIILKNKIEYYSEELSTDNKKKLYAEVSGAEFVGGYAYFVNDKSSGGKSPIFKIKFDEGKLEFKEIVYFTADKIIKSEKFEDITSTPDKKIIIAATAFDRVIPDTNKFDNYNKILNWNVESETGEGLKDDKIYIAHQTDNSGILSSVSLRKKIKKSLADSEFPEGPEYFKIEGLTTIPNEKIIMGVREYGKKYDDFKYSIKLISADYAIEDGALNIKDNWQLIYDFKTKGAAGLENQLGVSGLSFDYKQNILFVLTSFENKDSQFEGYLWHISLEDLFNGKPLKPVYDESGNSLLSFTPHKPEAITFLRDNRILIAFDDDRVTKYKEIKGSESREYGREPNEFWYEIIELDR